MINNVNKYFQNKRILITGATGYIGSNLVNKLINFDCKLILVSRSNHIHLKNKRATIKYVKANVTENYFWDDNINDIDIIFYLASQTSSQFANQNPLKDLNINLIPIVRFIDYCRKNNKFPDFIYAGAVTQSGLTKKLPVNEKIIDNPVTVYDINKLAVEKYLQYYYRILGGNSVTLRLANVYGPGPTSSNPDRGIVNLMIKNAISDKPITIFGTGNYIRDYIYIDDVIDSFIKSAVHINNLKGKYYIIGTGVGHTILEMVNIIKKEIKYQTNKIVKITYINFPRTSNPIEYRNFIADSSNFINKTGWKPKILLKQGIKNSVCYLLK